jgi:DNA-binding HxlR family transcriptional regulator
MLPSALCDESLGLWSIMSGLQLDRSQHHHQTNGKHHAASDGREDARDAPMAMCAKMSHSDYIRNSDFVCCRLVTDAPNWAAPMARPLDERCPVARALDIIGERWTLLILRDLMLRGPCRFQDFQANLVGISPPTLSARLKTLEDAGVVERRFYEQHPPRAEYLLTEKGEALRPAMRALRAWGDRYVPYCKRS